MDTNEAYKILLIVLTIIGSGISALLLVNAHFTRKTLERIASVDLNLAILVTNHSHTEERSKNNSFEVEKIKLKQERLESELKSIKEKINGN